MQMKMITLLNKIVDWYQQHLWLRLLSHYLLLGVVPVLLILLIVLYTAREVLEQNVLNNHRQAAYYLSREISTFFTEPHLRLVALSFKAQNLSVEELFGRTLHESKEGSNLSDWPPSESNPVKDLLRFFAAEAGVRDLHIVDAQGQIQASNVLPYSTFLPTHYDWDAIQKGVTDEASYISNITEYDGQSSLFMAFPLDGGRVLVARLDLNSLREKIERTDLGDNDHAVLLNYADGRYAMVPRRLPNYRGKNHPRIEDIRKLNGILRWRDKEGTAWITGFAPVHEDWIVAVEQREDEAFALLALLRHRTYLSIALAALAMVLLGWSTYRLVTVPITELAQAMRRRQANEELGPTPWARRDEIGKLTMAFIDMDAALSERQQALQRTLHFQRQLIEANPLAISVIDADYCIVQSNEAWNRLLGPQDELNNTCTGTQLRAWLETHPTVHAVDDLAIEDDNSIPRYWNLRTVPLGGTREGEILLVIEDQTQQRVLELHYVRAEKLAALGTMAAGMAHEIKNPLAIAQSTCDLLPHLHPDEVGERTTTLQAMRDAIHRIDQHITNLLDFARPPEDPKAPVDVVRVLEQLLDLENRHADHLGIAIQRQLQPMPLVSINEDMLKDIYLNIIRNAFQAMPAGGQLYANTRCTPEGVVVQICDTGVGIPPERIRQIFDPFYSTKPSGQGTGLGLSIVQRQLREIGGRIDVSSRTGEGTCFTLLLPFSDEELS